jgi:hypothetical protein
MKRSVFALAPLLALPLFLLHSPPTASAFPIPCPDGSTVEFGQFCPLPPWLGGPQPEEPVAKASPPDPIRVSQCSQSGGVWNTGLARCDILPVDAPPSNNLPAREIMSRCSQDKGVWNTEQGSCEYPNDKALANQCSLDKGVWNSAARRCDIL